MLKNPKVGKNKKSGLLKVIEASRPGAKGQQLVSDQISPTFILNKLSSFFLLGGIILIMFHQVSWGVGFIVVALAVLIPGLFHGKQPSWIKKIQAHLGPSDGVGLVLLLWIAFSAVTLTFPCFSWMFPKIQFLPFQQSYWLLFILFVGLVFAFRMMPEDKTIGNMSSNMARFWLLAVFVLTALINLHHASEPVGIFFDDQCCFIDDIRRMRDVGDFRVSFIFDYGKRPPFYEYFIWV